MKGSPSREPPSQFFTAFKLWRGREFRSLYDQYPDWIFYFVIKLVKNAQSGFESRTSCHTRHDSSLRKKKAVQKMNGFFSTRRGRDSNITCSVQFSHFFRLLNPQKYGRNFSNFTSQAE